MNGWSTCKNILCIRLDNMGDILMTSPAIHALKTSFKCKITILTSSMGKNIVSFIPCIDDCIIYDVPWVKSNINISGEDFFKTIELIKENNFDGAIIFSVFSQNPMASMMLAYLAGIPKRAGYCRENPYELLTDWLPDKEPYDFVQHQVRRDLKLVNSIGAFINDDRINLVYNNKTLLTLQEKLVSLGIDKDKSWVIFHPGVSEAKRTYPETMWIEIGRTALDQCTTQILVTGGPVEKNLAQNICNGIGVNSYNLAGELSIEEFIALIDISALVVSVNTSTIHIAAACKTPMIVLYALTNPQHAPWHGIGEVLPFSVESSIKSRNEVLSYIDRTFFKEYIDYPSPETVVDSMRKILRKNEKNPIPELITSSVKESIKL